MKLIKVLALGLIMSVAIPIVVPMTGCSMIGQIEDTPRGKYFQTQEAFIFAVTVALEQKRAGAISQGSWDDIVLPAINQGDALLDQMEAAAMSGTFDQLGTMRDVLIGIIAIIQRESE